MAILVGSSENISRWRQGGKHEPVTGQDEVKKSRREYWRWYAGQIWWNIIMGLYGYGWFQVGSPVVIPFETCPGNWIKTVVVFLWRRAKNMYICIKCILKSWMWKSDRLFITDQSANDFRVIILLHFTIPLISYRSIHRPDHVFSELHLSWAWQSRREPWEEGAGSWGRIERGVHQLSVGGLINKIDGRCMHGLFKEHVRLRPRVFLF